MTELPQRKRWDGRRAAPYAGPDPFEASRQLAEAEAAKRRAEEMTAEDPADFTAVNSHVNEYRDPAGQIDEP
jgi:hypothetical protein